MISRVSEEIHAVIELFEKKRSKLSFEEFQKRSKQADIKMISRVSEEIQDSTEEIHAAIELFEDSQKRSKLS